MKKELFGTLIAMIVLAYLTFLSFQSKPIEYRIVDGYHDHEPGFNFNTDREATFYWWDGTKSVQINSRIELLNTASYSGYELVSTSNYFIGANRMEQYIFKK